MEILNNFKDSFWVIVDKVSFQLFVFADYVIDLAEGDGRLLLVMIGLGFVLLILLLLMAVVALRGKKPARRKEAVITKADETTNPEESMGPEESMSLQQIEREMLDIREMYKTGRVSASVYVATSKKLYEKSIGQ